MNVLALLWFVACLFYFGASQVLPDPSIPCREPTNVTEMYETLRRTDVDLAAITRDESTIGDDHHDVTITALHRTCHHDHTSRICNCSARQELNFDDNRIPKALVQASCCSRNEENIAQWITSCREVYRDVRVLRRTGCDNGVYRYTQQWERVPRWVFMSRYPQRGVSTVNQHRGS